MDFSIIGKENPHFPRINYDGYRIIRTADKIRYMVNRLFGWTELRNCLDFLLNVLRCIRGVIDGLLQTKRPSIARQKAAFHAIKGGIWQKR